MDSSKNNLHNFNWLRQLRQAINQYFSESDVKTLCFDLHVDYESLPGDGKSEKVVELIKHFVRSGRLEELLNYCSDFRPNVPWDEIKNAAMQDPQILAQDISASVSQAYSPSSRSNRALQGLFSVKIALFIMSGLLLIAVGVLASNIFDPNKNITPSITPRSTQIMDVIAVIENATPSSTSTTTTTPTLTSTPTPTPTLSPVPTSTSMPTATLINTPVSVVIPSPVPRDDIQMLSLMPPANTPGSVSINPNDPNVRVSFRVQYRLSVPTNKAVLILDFVYFNSDNCTGDISDTQFTPAAKGEAGTLRMGNNQGEYSASLAIPAFYQNKSGSVSIWLGLYHEGEEDFSQVLVKDENYALRCYRLSP